MELDELRSLVGENIKRARLKAGYDSGRSFAAVLSFSHTLLGHYEKGTKTVPNDKLREISEVLGVSVASLRAVNYEEQEMIAEIESILSKGGDLARAINLSKKLFESSINDTKKVHAKELEGMALLKQGKAKNARLVFEEMQFYAERVRDKDLIHTSIALQARALYDAKEYTAALHLANDAKNYCSPQSVEYTKILQLQANIFADTNELDKALELHNEVLRNYRVFGMKDYILRTFHNIGDIHRRRKEYHDACQNLSAAVEIAYQISNVESIARTSVELAKVFLETNDVASARSVIERALVHEGIPPTQNARLRYYLSECLDDPNERIKLLVEAYDSIIDTDDVRIIHLTSKRLAEIAEHQGDTHSALMYYKVACNSIEGSW
ncbi:helix-turn-helix domain-containing protein [Tumebacillus flagellatus]|uniref:HTH cro/C1-type domain-containing protein n=1 Tax=Tumebacillus flagellatus TaxID=1157490 RepID=A0A074LM41_9BACL|nr:helix-turn-helix transcriptional regulator [Tumebacillus flagellatus]KEO80968.1 hypothetical protein EL26_23365 [Tumebacillus flagellatus]